MNQFTFDTRWDEIKGKLKQRFGQLTDDDLIFAEGKGQELLARLRQKLGVSDEQLDSILNDLQESVGGPMNRVREKAVEFANQAGSKASAVAGEVRAQAGVALDRAKVEARGFWEDAEEYVRQNPRDSLVAALFAGFVAGLLIRR